MNLHPRSQRRKPSKPGKGLLTFLALAFFLSVLTSAVPAQAQISIVGSVPEVTTNLLDKLKDIFSNLLKKSGSILMNSVVKNAVNTLAYESANRLATDMTGQKPTYEVKEWDEIWDDVGNSALGGFIDSLDEMWGVNICEPDINAKLKIGLGLKEQAAPPKPSCDWQTLKNNWEQEVLKADFSKKFAVTFEPTNSDLGMARYLASKMLEGEAEKKADKKLETVSNQGWLNPRNIGGVAKTFPGNSKLNMEGSNQAYWSSMGKVTGDIFTDAANVFLNQLALSTYQGIMANLTEKAGGSAILADADADPSSAGGAAGVRKSLSGIIEPRFNSRGDYDILGELSSCAAGPGGIGPTNCVIDDRFSQAIQQKKTVGQALKEGLLKKDAPFGFQTSGASAIEPSYLEGIPYRSMIILRKFRIIPVGWELAAQKINMDAEARQNAYLGKLVECYSDNDSYEGYVADWCRGLIDPDWVLKAPQNYCAKEGYGEQIINSQAVAQGVDTIDAETDTDGDKVADADEDVNGNGILDKARTISIPPKLIVNRLDGYCADEQSCISEKDDGSCEYYGYCTEELRKWNFNADSCEPVNNSCQTFKGEEGQSFSFLKNTLDFCTADNFGCERYAKSSVSSYVAAAKKNDWSKNDGFAYFNNNAQSCEAEGEGCHEFLRLRSGVGDRTVGTNLIRNSGFELNLITDTFDSSLGSIESSTEPSASEPWRTPERFWAIWGGGSASISEDAPGRGGKVLKIDSASSPAGFYSPDRSDGLPTSILPQGFVMEPETSYTLSADIYNINADRVVLMIGRDGQYWEEKEIMTKGSWVTESVTIKNNADILANEIRIYGYGAGNVQFYIDNIKFELAGKATPYSEYRQKNLVYEKLLPTYLESVCYEDYPRGDYRLKSDAPAECRQYARKCNRDEANCEMFTASKDNAKIPAAVTDKDYCLAECNGFDAYIQTESNFNSRRAFYFIPRTAKTCTAAQAGCEEFTNLDKSDQGGESREYYSYLRQCVKPNTPGNTCASFYTWEGNNEQGEQLALHSLKAEASGDVALTRSDLFECDEDIFNYPSNDPRYNPDCRKFYNQAGAVSYHLYSRTISCTDDCHPYRMSNKNIDTSKTFAAICSGADEHWDSLTNTCQYCTNGGYWSDEHNSCIYNATPAESVSCPSFANGCAEFNGNQGNNVRQLFVSAFEGGSDNWTNGSQSTFTVSGKGSLIFNSNINRQVGDSVINGGSYAVSFVARSAVSGSVWVNVSFQNDSSELYFSTNAEKDYFVEVRPNEWGVYQLNLASLDHEVADNERLVIYSSDTVYIDNIKLSAIAERYYLVRDSWVTPASCNQDENGKPYPLYMLGCGQYKDRLGNTHYLHRFSRICQESAVGCEAMIDTQNSVRQSSEYFAANSGTLVPSDRVVYAVYDVEKKCKTGDKGCELFGLARDYENSYTYTDIRIKNDPDRYSSTLCSQEGVGCDKWASDDGDFYFKNPGDMVCEWRIGKLPGRTGSDWAWFKTKVKHCGGSGAACSSDAECSGGQKCIMDNRPDEQLACPVDALKTFGQGGIGNQVYQPTVDGSLNWVGLCAAEQSGCTEYIDPVSEFSSNLIYNADFKQNIDVDSLADGWQSPDSPRFYPNPGYQKVFLEGNNLYVLVVEGDNAATVSIDDDSLATDFRPFYRLGNDNNLEAVSVSEVGVAASSSLVFYVEKNTEAVVFVSDYTSSGNDSRVILRKAITDYQLSKKVDKKSCNGDADMGDGCVYFNERAVVGASGLAPLNKNSWQEYSPGSDEYINKNNGLKDSNSLLKVSPDRTCSQWLSCKTYVKGGDNKPVCFDIAECDRLDAGGNCANFVSFTALEQDDRVYDPKVLGEENPETIKNSTGYAKVAYADSSTRTSLSSLPSDYLRFGLMEQQGVRVEVSNGNFELSNKAVNEDRNVYVFNPASWSPTDSVWTSAGTEASMFKVINDPVSAQKLGIDYPAEGAAFLQYSPANTSSFPFSDAIRLAPGREYYLSFMINTSKLVGTDAYATVNIFKRGSEEVVETFSVESSLEWTTVRKSFSPDVSIVNLQLGAEGSALGGYIYVDDIKITPVLQAKESASPWWIGQSCRLYPKEDSLSCDYYDDAGMRLKGDYGYCLEYDRPPGNPDTCLLWWPIDKVSGQGEGTKAAAASEVKPFEPAPLFYCVAAPNSYDSRPYIDASTVEYLVDEFMQVKVNGVLVTRTLGQKTDWVGLNNDHSDHQYQRGSLTNTGSGRNVSALRTDLSTDYIEGNRIYLNYGVNNISVGLDSDESLGATFLLMAGRFYYYDSRNILKSGTFNLTNQGEDRTSEVSETTTSGPVEGQRCFIAHSSLNDGMDDWVLPGILGGDYLNGGCCGSLCTYCDQKRDYIVDNGVSDDDDNCWRGGEIGSGYANFTITIPANYPCTSLAQVVDRNGANKAWAERTKESSTYTLPCNANLPAFVEAYAETTAGFTVDKSCDYSSDSTPFGSLMSPGTNAVEMSSPGVWGELNDGVPGDSDKSNNKALMYSANPADARMGQLYSKDDLSYLFAESYGVWDWNSSEGAYVINHNSTLNWESPTRPCSGNIRTTDNPNCSVRPVLKNTDNVDNSIKLNGGSNAAIFGRGFVNLTFNSQVDAQQAPMTMYEIDWGDGEKLTVSGADMKTMPNASNPHSAYHAYDYWDVYGKYKLSGATEKMPTVYCRPKDLPTHPYDYCTLKPKVKIKDNWGWCTEGRDGVACPTPATAVCQNPDTLAIQVKPNCRDYSASFSSLDQTCLPSYKRCSDGYYESVGEVVIYNYSGE